MNHGSGGLVPDGLGTSDEGRHGSDGSEGWEESWHFDAISVEGDLGLSLRLGRQPMQRNSPIWGCLVRDGHPLVHLVDLEIPLTRDSGSIGARGEGIWVDATCEIPFEHWSLGLEAFAVALDDPAEALGNARGDRIALGLDLEWESASGAMCFETEGSRGYQMMCRVHGEVLIGSDVVEFDGWGSRQHLWGTAPWHRGNWRWGGGTLHVGPMHGGEMEDGTADHNTTWHLNPDGSGRFGLDEISSLDVSNWPESLTLQGHPIQMRTKHEAPVLVRTTHDDVRIVVKRSLVELKDHQGMRGSAWLEEADFSGSSEIAPRIH